MLDDRKTLLSSTGCHEQDASGASLTKFVRSSSRKIGGQKASHV